MYNIQGALTHSTTRHTITTNAVPKCREFNTRIMICCAIARAHTAGMHFKVTEVCVCVSDFFLLLLLGIHLHDNAHVVVVTILRFKVDSIIMD